jgi:hypothetical protein
MRARRTDTRAHVDIRPRLREIVRSARGQRLFEGLCRGRALPSPASMR